MSTSKGSNMKQRILEAIEQERVLIRDQGCAYGAMYYVNTVLTRIIERIEAECVEILDIPSDSVDAAEETDGGLFPGRRPNFAKELSACAAEGCKPCHDKEVAAKKELNERMRDLYDPTSHP